MLCHTNATQKTATNSSPAQVKATENPAKYSEPNLKAHLQGMTQLALATGTVNPRLTEPCTLTLTFFKLGPWLKEP